MYVNGICCMYMLSGAGPGVLEREGRVLEKAGP